MTNPEIQKFLAQRAALKRQMNGEFAGLRQRAIDGRMGPQELRAALEDIQVRYLGADAAAELKPGLDQLMAEYDRLYKSVGQLDALTQLFDQLQPSSDDDA